MEIIKPAMEGTLESSDAQVTVELTLESAVIHQFRNQIRCEMTPTSAGGEQQISISGGRQSPSDIASGRIAEMRRRSMSCIA